MLERITDRIYKIAAAELPIQAVGLIPLGLDVCWGKWNVMTPNGPAQNETLAILLAFRAMGPRGDIILGNALPVTNAYVLSGLWPSESEIKTGVATSCNIVRKYIESQGRNSQNGGPK